MYIVAIDPGQQGALCVLSDRGALVALHDTPVLTLTVQRGSKQVYDVPGMVDILRPSSGLQAHVYIEASQAMQGVEVARLREPCRSVSMVWEKRDLHRDLSLIHL